MQVIVAYMSGTIHKDCRRARSLFHHLPTISLRLQRFSAQKSVGQQRHLKPGDGSALTAMEVKRVSATCIACFLTFVHLSELNRAFNLEKDKMCTQAGKLTRKRRKRFVSSSFSLFRISNSHYCNYTADCPLKGRKHKVSIEAATLPFVAVIESNRMMVFTPPLPPPTDHMPIKM